MPNGRRVSRKTTDATANFAPTAKLALPASPAPPAPPPPRIVTAREVTTWFYKLPSEVADLSTGEALSTIVTTALLADEAAARDVLFAWGARKDRLPNLCGPPHGAHGLPGDYVLVNWLVRQQPLVHLGLFRSRDPRVPNLRAKIESEARHGYRIATHPPVGLGAFAVVAVRMARFWFRVCSECRVAPN